MNKLFLIMTSYQAANKAHEELQQFAKKWHHALVDNGVLENAVVELQREIIRINQTHARCKDITMNVNRNTHNRSSACEYKGIYNIAVESNFYISVHEVKSEVLIAHPLDTFLIIQSILADYDQGKIRTNRLVSILKSLMKSVIKELQ